MEMLRLGRGVRAVLCCEVWLLALLGHGNVSRAVTQCWVDNNMLAFCCFCCEVKKVWFS